MAEAIGASDLETFIQHKLISGIQEARRLRVLPHDETEPYKYQYASASLLESLEQEAARFLTHDLNSNDLVHQCIAACQIERGLALIETDITADGQKALEQGVGYKWPCTLATHAIMQQACNALGSLWCSREAFKASLQYLQHAAEHYHKTRAITQISCSFDEHSVSETSPELQNSASALRQDQTPAPAIVEALFAANSSSEQVEQQYTITLYHLAQVYAIVGDNVQSASYCAATLNRQLKQGTYDKSEWVQNCLQLSGYFLDGNAFALSEYCCAAVESMLLQSHPNQQHQAVQVDALSPAAKAHDQQQQQQGNDNCASQKHNEGSVAEHADGSITGITSSSYDVGHMQPEVLNMYQVSELQHLSKAAAKQQASSSRCHTASSLMHLQPALGGLDADVAANLQLAFAKLHLYRLVASHVHFVEGKQLQFSFSAPGSVPDVLCFSALPGLPQLSALKWGYDALAQSYEDALQLFKQALPLFKGALQHYKLDGWVTEHCHILFEMSNLYRCLAGFEADPHKRCVMHRSRAKLLQGLEGQLSPAHYPGLSRSISLELGNIFREIGDIKAAAGREPEKVAAAGLSAAQYYQSFLDSFKGPDGKVPAKVEQEMEHHFVSAAFCLARVLQVSAGSHKDPRTQVATLEQAAHWLDATVEYVNGNKMVAHQEEAQLALEMSQLLEEKLTLMRRIQNPIAN